MSLMTGPVAWVQAACRWRDCGPGSNGPQSCTGKRLVVAAFILDDRQGFKLMEARRRRQRPFQRVSGGTPWIACSFAGAPEGVADTDEEHQCTERSNV